MTEETLVSCSMSTHFGWFFCLVLYVMTQNTKSQHFLFVCRVFLKIALSAGLYIQKTKKKKSKNFAF